MAAASWIFDAGVYDHRADVLECPPAELAGEIAGNVAVEGLVVTPARMACAGVKEKRPRVSIRLSAVFAVLAHVTPSQIMRRYPVTSDPTANRLAHRQTGGSP